MDAEPRTEPVTISATERHAAWSGIAISAAYVALPTAIWLFGYPPGPLTWQDWHAAASYLGKTVSIPGAALFTLALVLSARVKPFERVFGDISASYRVHQWIGGLATILISAHPIGLAFGYLAISPHAAASFLLPISGLEKTLGIIALLLLQAAIVLTYWGRIPYDLWKLSHKTLGAACAIGIVHALTIPGAISDLPLLKATLAIYLALGLGAWTYRSLLGRWIVPRSAYRVRKVDLSNPRHVELDLAPEGKPLAAKAGQFAFVTVLDPAVPIEEHPFSIAGIGADGSLRFVAKALGDFTSRMKGIRDGALALVEGPYGRFGQEAGQRQVWIAGGIGVTPFLGMAETLPAGYSADLYWSYGRPEDAVGLDRLEAVAASNPAFRIVPWPSAEKGRLTVEAVAAGSGPLAEKDFLICGPAPMVASLGKNLRAAGVSSGRIHQESFDFR